MQDKSVSKKAPAQVLDLTGCNFNTIPDTGIRLSHPTGEAAKRLGKKFKIPSRMRDLLKVARRGIGDQERFLQDYRLLGHSPGGNLVYAIITILATTRFWRGGWFLASVPLDEVEVFKRHVESARTASVDELRTERRQHGSKN